MVSQSYDHYDQISLWTNEFKGQKYLHMQQKPYQNESKRSRYVFLHIEIVPRLQEKVDSILAHGECKDDPINVRTDFEVMLIFKQPRMWELKVVPVTEKTRNVSHIDIADISAFGKALKLLNDI